jgi:pyruvate kinase
MISKYRPDAHIIVQTPYLRATRELSLVWGVTACYRPELEHMEKDLEARAISAIRTALKDGLVHQDDHVIVIGSSIVDPSIGISMELYDVAKIMNKLQ